MPESLDTSTQILKALGRVYSIRKQQVPRLKGSPEAVRSPRRSPSVHWDHSAQRSPTVQVLGTPRGWVPEESGSKKNTTKEMADWNRSCKLTRDLQQALLDLDSECGSGN